MKSEAQTKEVLWRYNQLSIPSFGSYPAAGCDAEELSKLRIENARLQQLVAELLIANQQLRRRYADSGSEAERSDRTAAPIPYRHDN